MARFLETIADAYFIPNDDGTVGFVLGRPEDAHVTLSGPEAEAIRPLWRSLVKCHILAAHSTILIEILSPLIGGLILLGQWLAGIWLAHDLRSRWRSKVAEGKGHRGKVFSRLAEHVPRRRAMLLGTASLLAAVFGATLLDRLLVWVSPELDPSYFCFFVLALRWSIFFFGIAVFSERRDVAGIANDPQRSQGS